ncbi:SDR family NAD(P)-dependent oxidoreductase, partial [Rhizobium ruizarguesonis]
ASINSDSPNPTLLSYATTKGAIQNFTAGLAQLLAEKGIRANAVAPGSIWLGARLYHYGLAYARSLDFMSIATHEMHDLCRQAGETV